MKKGELKKIYIDMILYGILLLPLHSATAAAVDWILKKFALLMINAGVSYAVYAPLGVILAVILLFTFPIGVTLGLLYLRFPRQYEPGSDRRLWWIKAFLIILPGEFARFLLCLWRWWYSASFARLPYYLFTYVYLPLVGHDTAVRQQGNLVPVDYFGYAVCHLLYLAVYLPGIIFFCRFLWKKGKIAYEDLLGPEA